MPLTTLINVSTGRVGPYDSAKRVELKATYRLKPGSKEMSLRISAPAHQIMGLLKGLIERIENEVGVIETIN